MGAKKKDSLKYGDARRKLEEILKEIEGNEVDVDDLADRVKEAAQLIKLCREKLQKTRLEVEKVVSQMGLDQEGSPPAKPSDSAGEGGDADADGPAPF